MGVETYEVILSGTVSGQFVQNILHCNLDNTADTDPFVVANAILTKINGAGQFLQKWCDCLPADYLLTSARCRRVTPAGGPTQIFLSANLNYNSGNRSGNAGVSSNAPLIIWLTTLRPAKTGRTFVPGVSESDVSENTLVAGLLTALAAAATVWRDGFTPASPAYPTQGSILRRALHGADDITNFRVSPIVGTQRRRQRPI
jgi:hypothetical protein